MEPVLAMTGTLAAATAPLAALWHHARWVAYHRRKGLPVPGSGLAVLGAEAQDMVAISAWYLAGWFRDGLRRPEEVHGRPVLCVHGYTQNGTNFIGIRRALEGCGRPTLAVSLRHRLAPVARYAERLEAALEQAVSLDDDGLDVVCHSMGGVVLRVVLARRPDLAGRVRHAVTLGTPHRGTAAARGIPLLPEVQALKRRSALLADLPPLVALVPRVTNLAGTLDTIVYPVSSALEPGAAHHVFPVGHAGLLTRREAVDAVVRALIER